MAFCKYCGRPLGEGEICNCTLQNQAQGYDAYGQPIQAPGYDAYGQPIQAPGYNAYGQPNQVQPPKKKSNGAVIAIVIIVLVLAGIGFLILIAVLAAILVPSMIGYTHKSKQASINAQAKTLYNTTATVLTQLDAEGTNVMGTYIICSDEYDNVNVPFEASLFYDCADDYFPEIDSFTYFVVVQNGNCTYAAIAQNGEDFIGTSPYATSIGTDEGPTTISGYYGDEDWDLEDLYYDTYEYLFY